MFDDSVAKLNVLLTIFVDLFTSLGVLLFVWGVYKLILSLKDEASSEKIEAVCLIVTAIMLISCKTWLNFLLGSKIF